MAVGPDIDVFYGQLSAHNAQVYVRVNQLPGGGEWTIAGRVRGPVCRHAQTLPANHALADLGPGASLLARAIIPDPCFWSPDLPALYQVSVELRRRDSNGSQETVFRAERELGLRWLGTRGDRFYFEGKRWVLRGIHRQRVIDTPLADWREAGAAMLVEKPSDEFCREAAHEGVLLVVGGLVEPVELRRLSQWASVGIVAGPPGNGAAQRSCPNLIWASREADSAPSGTARFVDAELLATPQHGIRNLSQPVIAFRRLSGMQSLEAARAEVDRLQRDLAPYGDFAGYVIDGP